MSVNIFNKQVFAINDENTFNSVAIEIFRYQYHANSLYRQYVDLLKTDVQHITHYSAIPFLPISIFKSHAVVCGTTLPQQFFISSGTGGTQSKHYILDVTVYIESFTRGFHYFYGNPEKYCLLALLPSYFERKNSSLVFMVNHLMQLSQHPLNGFYLNEHNQLYEKLVLLNESNQPTLLLGVTFALLDFAAKKYKLHFPTLTLMETGGMKGRRTEPVREEVHQILSNAFGVNAIHSEYGMTEIFSQAYSAQNGQFNCPPWMKVLTRDPHDPLSLLAAGKVGGINIIDLANYNTCSFIASQDLGKVSTDGTFEISGRFDASDIRGCSLLTA
ncbi:MAG: acyltransferase [Lentimicrobiaceae bacterium]|nr:acyltransferase [Lentimicrobiaceae bacterium]